MREMKIAYGSSCFAKVWSNKTITFDALCERLKNTIRTPETVEEYPKLSKAERDRAKDKGGMVGGWLKQGGRKASNVECRSMLTHDIDSADPDFLERYRMLNKYASCLYSTRSHTPEAPRYRIITPLTRDVSPEEYLALTRLLAKEWGIDCVDSCSYRAHQLMYWPTTPSNGEYVFERFDGAWLNPDAFLSAHPGWRDVSLLPTSSRESTLIDRQRKQQADPLAKPGIVGAFCRTYSIEEAIDTFLSDVYQPSAMAGRYDYVPADSSAGVVLYDGKFAYSHHATDPACGQLLNALDLVRIHRFRDLDDKASADTAPSKLPSYKVMCDFAVQDEGVKKTLAEDRAAQAQEDFKENDNWQPQLDLERNGTIKDTMANISAILCHDPNLQGIVYNQFSNLLDVREALPWQQVKPGWSDTDLACAKLYFERCYGIWSPTKFKDALLAVTSAERLYHPVRDYLESLVWDGMPRLLSTNESWTRWKIWWRPPTASLCWWRKKMKINEGEVPQYYVENSHPAIVSDEVYEEVQLELQRRRKQGRQHNSQHCFSGRIYCGCCGSVYGSKVWYSNDKYRRTVWQCNARFVKGTGCQAPHLSELMIEQKFLAAFNQLLAQRGFIAEDMQAIIRQLINTAELDAEKEALQVEMGIISELIRQVVSQNASAALDQAEYNRKYDSLTERFHKAADRVKEIDVECARRKGQRREIETFRDAVLANDQPVTVFSTELWNATIDRMTVNLDGSVKMAFRNGIEITV